MKALLQYRASPGFRARLTELAEATGVGATAVEEDDDAGFAGEARDADVLLHVLKPVTAAMIDQAPRLKLIQKLGVGVNTIDLDAARARGIAVCNMPGTNSAAVAEMTLGLMLAVLRRLVSLDSLTRAGCGWRPDLALIDSLGELGGRTVGFFGYGAVPQRLAPALTALGARLIYHAPSERPEAAARRVSFDELLAGADVLSLHAPLTEATRGAFDREALARVRPGAILINTARGELIDPAALHQALVNGPLAAAGLDVFATEPLTADDPLLKLANVVVTPHLAWLTPETLNRSLIVAMENCRRLAAGEPLEHRVA